MQKVMAAFAAIFLSGLAYYFTTGFYATWWLAWFSPIPLLLYGFRYSLKNTLIVAFFAGLIGNANTFYYLSTFLPIKLQIMGCLSGAISLCLLFGLSRLLMRHVLPCLMIFVFPVLSVLFEFITSLSSSGALASYSYSQMGFLPAIQMAVITGYYGVTFVLALFASSLSVAIYYRQSIRPYIASLIFALILIIACLSFGYYRVATWQPVASLKVAMLADPENIGDLMRKDRVNAFAISRMYANSIQHLKARGISLIVLPEKNIKVTRTTRGLVQLQFSAMAKMAQAYLVVGIDDVGDKPKRNIAWVFNPSGRLLDTYDKEHMLPGPESGYRIGGDLLVFNVRGYKVGVIICKDADFVSPAIRYSQQGINLLVVPALDFNIDAWLHSRPAMMRAVEGNYSLVRVAQWGLLLSTTPVGRVLAYLHTNDQASSVLIRHVPLGRGRSVFSQEPTWFVWLMLAIFLLLLVSVFFKRRAH